MPLSQMEPLLAPLSRCIFLKPAVSRLVTALEEKVGFRLFKRVATGLRPTPEAGYLFNEVEKALANLNHIARMTEDLQDRKWVDYELPACPVLQHRFCQSY